MYRSERNHSRIGGAAPQICSRGETALFSSDVTHSAVQAHRPESDSANIE
jgi:hypothetical protein